MTQISKINSLVLTVYATDANMYINVKGNVPGGLTMANEKRLIDAHALIAEYDRVHVGEPGKARKLMEEAPTVDAVPVVRCEKCKHAVWDEEYKMWKCVEDAEYDEESGVWFGYCEYHDPEFFCGAGERKDGDGNG